MRNGLLTCLTALVGAGSCGAPASRRETGPGLWLATSPFCFARRCRDGPAAYGVQFLNLKLAMRVFQLKLPVVAMYCCVYQKVQSSVGSMLIEL